MLLNTLSTSFTRRMLTVLASLGISWSVALMMANTPVAYLRSFSNNHLKVWPQYFLN